MRKKIFRSLIFISVMVMILSSVISTAYLHDYFNDEQIERLKVELDLVADAVNELGDSYLDYVDDETIRFTIIDADGNVIYDTKADAETMENHADREEVIEALQSGSGSSERYSQTLTEKTLYEAVKLDDGTILRVSVSQLTLSGAFLRVLPMNLLIAGLGILLSLYISKRMSENIIEPLATLDLDNPGENDTYDELTPVLSKIQNQHQQLAEQMEELKEKNEEFSQILSSMTEGLIILDEDGDVLSMNESARKIFNVPQDAIGENFLTIDRNIELNRAIEATAGGDHSEITLSKNGREYQITINRIESDGKFIGTLLLAFDNTEKAFAERNRQEFTANVSHELKTPLQSIIGLSEMIESGIVKSEDIAHFAGNIHKEASRLYSLIEDIIQLSQLDEKVSQAFENVDIKEVAAEAMQVLKPSALKHNVTMTLDCDDVTIKGIRRYVYEIIYNLGDNAIRYNKEGGKVDIVIKKDDKNCIITVADTGIGIPLEHQDRIFERFYRVDKSHSRETGGTGLGLSIVKRAVMFHNGTIELNSLPNEGTTIKVTLPLDCRQTAQ